VTGSMRRVRLHDVDVRRFWELEQHHEAMLRELTLIAIGTESGSSDGTPAEVVQLVSRTRARFESQREGLFRSMREAAEAGEDTLTVELDLPASAAEAIRESVAAFDLADDYCRSGELLTLATPPGVAAFRRELCEQITGQLDADVS
jgi:hypothetical protein